MAQIDLFTRFNDKMNHVIFRNPVTEIGGQQIALVAISLDEIAHPSIILTYPDKSDRLLATTLHQMACLTANMAKQAKRCWVFVREYRCFEESFDRLERHFL